MVGFKCIGIGKDSKTNIYLVHFNFEILETPRTKEFYFFAENLSRTV